jgi:hypothetical protein
VPRIGSIEKRAEPRMYEASAMPAMLGAKRAAAINIDHVRVGTSKRLVLVRTSSEQEAQHKERRSDEYQPRLDDSVSL